MARDLDPFKLSSPRIFLVRMMVFLILCGLVVVVLNKQIVVAFMANPGLNALIIAVLVIGILLAFRQVIRLFPEVRWVNGFRLADPGLAVAPPAVLLAPMATILKRARRPHGDLRRTMRGLMDSIATRLDEARDIPLHDQPARVPRPARHVLGLDRDRRLGRQGDPEPERSAAMPARSFDSLREGLARPLSGMGISFSSSLFGLAGSLALGFLDLQAGQAQNRFYMELEDWLSTIVSDLGSDAEPRTVISAAPSGEMRSAIDKLKEAVAETGSNRAATAAMANLAEAIHGLVSHMRTEQQMIRDWADGQAAQGREVQRLLERIAGEEPKDDLRKTAP